MRNFPQANPEAASKYAEIMLQAAKNICVGAKINPKVRVPEEIKEKYPYMLSSLVIETIDLIILALCGIMLHNQSKVAA